MDERQVHLCHKRPLTCALMLSGFGMFRTSGRTVGPWETPSPEECYERVKVRKSLQDLSIDFYQKSLVLPDEPKQFLLHPALWHLLRLKDID